MVETFTSQNFKEEVLDSNLSTLVDFWAPWCAPCQMMGPIIDKLAEEYKGKVKIGKVNVDETENKEIAIQYGIQGIPSFKIFKDGKVISEFVGMQNEETLKKKLEEAS